MICAEEKLLSIDLILGFLQRAFNSEPVGSDVSEMALALMSLLW